MRTVKSEVRVLGVDDAPFTFDDETTDLIGTVFRGGTYIEGVLQRDITVDGRDVTDTIASMVQGTQHTDQLQAVMLDGVTFAGFNVVDLQRLHEETGLPVIAVSRNEPDWERMEAALDNVEDAAERKQLIEQAGTVKAYDGAVGTTYFQHEGVAEEQVEELLEVTAFRSIVPEPVRVAHLIAAAVKNGESKGGA